jgi:hypothetical protein
MKLFSFGLTFLLNIQIVPKWHCLYTGQPYKSPDHIYHQAEESVAAV